MCQRHNNVVSQPRRPRAFTLTEILIAVAILALLVTVLVVGASFVQNRNKAILTKSNLGILTKAIEEFRDITGHFPRDVWEDDDAPYDEIDDETGSRINGAELTDGTAPESSELLYLQLSLLPQTRAIIANFPEQLLAGSSAEVTLAGQGSPTRYLRSVVDAWGYVLRYERDTAEPDDVFPDLWSSGPDGESDSDYPETEADDIRK